MANSRFSIKSNMIFGSRSTSFQCNCEKIVKYTTYPPTKSAIESGRNPYADEPGFLSNFSAEEINRIITVNHDEVMDLVYLLSENEVNSYIGNSDSDRSRQITQKGKKSKGALKLGGDNYWFYWTRTKDVDSSYYVRSIDFIGNINSDFYANIGSVRVLPALQINSYIPKNGNGTKENPWEF